MELILWRHADAEDGKPDLERELTGKGRKQAQQVAKWLGKRLPERSLLLSSPAARAQQTAQALDMPIRTVKGLAPGAAPRDILKAADWPNHEGLVIVVGHQPDLGRCCSYLVCGANLEWSLKKGGLWWLEYREREEAQVVVRAVMSPDLL